MIISFKIRAREGQAFLNRKPRWEVDPGGLGHGAKEPGPGFQDQVQVPCPSLLSFPDEFG